MVEGDLWRYAQTDLTDFYRGALTLRQVWVRFIALPAEAAIWERLREQDERAESARKLADIDDVMQMVGGGPRA